MRSAASVEFGEGLESLRIERIRPILRDQVLEVIRNAILDLRFKPGDRLIERELCELTGVSRTSVREALRHLESEGLVRNFPHQGPIVAVVDLKEAREIYELREALEGLAGRLFAERASEAQMTDLQRALDALSQAFATGEMRTIIRQTMKFYDVFLEGCGNSLIASTIRSLQARMVQLRATSMSQPGRAPRSLAEMQDIVAAVMSRDADRAGEACMKHVRCAREAAMATLTANNSES
jgi:GntR family transcriptional regulator, trigonelline degradation regulator